MDKVFMNEIIDEFRFEDYNDGDECMNMCLICGEKKVDCCCLTLEG